jgi:uncharacterized membrane protein YesL
MLEHAVKEAPKKAARRDDADDLRRHIDAYSGFVMANLLWALVALPVVTLPLATLGLMAVMSARVRGRMGNNLFVVFFHAIRTRWRPAMLIGLIDFALGALIAVNTHSLLQMAQGSPMQIVSGAVTLFGTLTVLSANVYAWGILALDSIPARRVIEMSLRFAFAYPLHTFAMLIASAAVIAVSLLLPRGVLVLVTASAVAYVIAWGSWRVIRRHLTAEEMEEYAGVIRP